MFNQIKSIAGNPNFRHGILYTFLSFINSGFSFILILILSKYLSPFEYGQLNLFTTFVTLNNIIITLCTITYVGVCFFQKDNATLQKVIVVALGTTTIMLMCCSIVLVVFPQFVTRCIGIPIKYLWLGLLICYFMVFSSLNLDIWRREEKPMKYGVYSVSSAICNFTLSFWLIVGLKLGWEGRIYAWWLLAFLYFIISLSFLIKRKYLVVCFPSYDLVKETLIYSLPLLPHSVSFWLKQGMDRYIINYFHDQTSVGYFSFAMNLAAIIGIIGNAFNASNSVYIYKQLTIGYTRVSSVLKRQTRMMTGIFILVSLLVCVGASTLVSVFLPKYINSLPYILPLCIGAFFQCIYLLWVNYLFFYKRTKKLMLITSSTAILQVLLSIWLTRYNILYTAYISMFISAIMMLLVRNASQKLLN